MANIRRQRRTRASLLKSRSNTQPKRVNVFKRINHYQPDGTPTPASPSKYRKFGQRSTTRMKKHMMSNTNHQDQLRSRMIVTNTNEGLRPIRQTSNFAGVNGTGGAPNPVTADMCTAPGMSNHPWCILELTPYDFIGGGNFGGPGVGGGGDDESGGGEDPGGPRGGR